MKSLSWLTGMILLDSGIKCGADVSRDKQIIARRVKVEGESFLTITLPAFCTGFERALAEGTLLPSHTPAFGWHERGLPRFLRGFLEKVFNRDGTLLGEPCVESIACIRQICLLHKKTLRVCSERRMAAALDKFTKCEDEVYIWTDNCQRLDDRDHAYRHACYIRVASIIWSDLMRAAPYGDVRHDLRPAHGPGATRERIRGNAKYVFKRWHRRLEEYFPFTEFGLASVRNEEDMTNSLDTVNFVEPQDEEPVRVVFVPKTQKTPRVIAIEPVCMQYVQQGLMRWLVPQIESGRYTAGRVNFTRQDINRKLALEASVDGSMATLDLSEASDRVSLTHVDDMLRSVPLFREHVMACRSTRAELPNGVVIPLKKFASMGSALCFPMEAMVFFCIIITHRLLSAGVAITPKTVYKYSRDVYVYGDDLIVPSDEAPAIGQTLSAFGLRVNDNKSFWTGLFRESCGMDAYRGYEVTPTYCRHDAPTNRRDASALTSWTSMANQLYKTGYWKSAQAVRNHVESILGTLPHLGDEAQGLSWSSFSNWTQGTRWNKHLMRFETRTWVPTPVRQRDHLDGDAALLKCFSTIGETMDVRHLEQSVARGRLTLKSRWVPSL